MRGNFPTKDKQPHEFFGGQLAEYFRGLFEIKIPEEDWNFVEDGDAPGGTKRAIGFCLYDVPAKVWFELLLPEVNHYIDTRAEGHQGGDIQQWELVISPKKETYAPDEMLDYVEVGFIRNNSDKEVWGFRSKLPSCRVNKT